MECKICHREFKALTNTQWYLFFRNLQYGNQQPSLDRNIFEGSETRRFIQTGDAVDGKPSTSAAQPINFRLMI